MIFNLWDAISPPIGWCKYHVIEVLHTLEIVHVASQRPFSNKMYFLEIWSEHLHCRAIPSSSQYIWKYNLYEDWMQTSIIAEHQI